MFPFYQSRSTKSEDLEFFTKLQEMLPNLPVLHWWANENNNVDNKCWAVPNILDLQYNNKYWQVKDTRNGTFYLYAAYYDTREVLAEKIEKNKVLN